MADKKRFSEPKTTYDYSLFSFSLNRVYNLHYKLIEKKNTQYIVSNIEAYKKLIDNLSNKKIKNFSCFISKGFTNKKIRSISFFEDIIINTNMCINRNSFKEFNEIGGYKKILLLTNTRLESPTFHSFLFKNMEDYSFVSMSTFASNLIKEELPLSIENVNKILKGNYDLSDFFIINSIFNFLPRMNNVPSVILKPLYLNEKYKPLKKEIKSENFLFFFQKLRKTFKESFASSILVPGFTNICLQNNSFDSFIQKKISIKFLERLFILFAIIKWERKNNINYSLHNNSERKENDISILFQSFKTI